MKKILLLIISISLSIQINAQIKDNLFNNDSIFAQNDPQNKEKHFVKAGIEVAGLNVFVNAFDRFVLDADFAEISLHSIKHNLEYGFVWDNDKFATNLFFHPYHGNLYFNAARSNGLSFIQSVPYAFFGSLMWEECGEIEPAAVNDLFATTFGGICLGEITFRLSNLILDDSKTGWERFFREFLCTAISPMKGLNRILNGQAWKVSNKFYKYHNYEAIPVHFSASAGIRYLTDHAHFTKGEGNPYVDLHVLYGDVFNTDNNQPYDYFTAEVTAGLSPNQPILSHVSLLGRLWGVNLQTVKGIKKQFGVFQHFNYYDSDSFIDGSDDTPYKISEAVAFGAGLITEFPFKSNLSALRQRLFINAIVLGGSASDYYRYIDRNYNMGSGFSARVNTEVEFAKYGMFRLNAEYYRIFTWKGYEQKDYTSINPLYLNSQGDKSTASLLVINPNIEFFLNKAWNLELGAYYFLRNTEYDYFKNVESRTFEVRMGVKYHL